MTNSTGREPIPGFYEKGPSHVPRVAVASSAAVGARPWYRKVPGFRSGKWPKAIVAVIGYLVIAAWIVQFPFNPALGVLGILAFGVVVLVFNVGQVRTRLPVFRSSNRLVSALGWAGLGIAMLFAAAYASPVSGPAQQPNSTAAIGSASPTSEGQPSPSSTASATTTASPTPNPSPSPTPSPSPSASPSPIQQPPAATPITFLNAPLRAAPGETVTLNVSTAPNVYCTVEVVYKSGPSNAQGLSPKTSSPSGAVRWTWTVGARTTPGTGPIPVSSGNKPPSTNTHVT